MTQQILESNLFAIRGDLDGGLENTFTDYKQFIGLIIDEEEFFLSIEHVREIIMLTNITLVPNCPKNIAGVINLRGTILPVVNLPQIIADSSIKTNGNARLIIANNDGIDFSLIVHGISYVLNVPSSDISTQTNDNYIKSFARRDDKVTGILDLDKVLAEVAQPEE